MARKRKAKSFTGFFAKNCGVAFRGVRVCLTPQMRSATPTAEQREDLAVLALLLLAAIALSLTQVFS